MSDAREEILRRIREALGDRDADAADGAAGPADAVGAGAGAAGSGAGAAGSGAGAGVGPDRDALAELLCERIRDYAAQALRVPVDGVAAAVADACAERGLERLVVAPGVPAAWRPRGGPIPTADDGLSPAELDEAGAVLTGCALAIAETGTVVLDGGPESGRRVLTLVPDHHICVVRAERIVHRVPAAIAVLHDAVARGRAPLTFVSGASATSDIELQRVEGVHGPRDLLVLIAG